jgi:hypothetical protein
MVNKYDQNRPIGLFGGQPWDLDEWKDMQITWKRLALVAKPATASCSALLETQPMLMSFVL